MARGNKGERRDPGKLLREEKMRKRIAKELPKVEADLKKILEQWEDEYGRPFLVLGDRYLDELYASASRAAPPRSKTPVAPPPAKQAPKSVPRNRANTIHGDSIKRAKTPTAAANFGASVSRNPLASSIMSTSVMGSAAGSKSPSKIPARAPLKTMPHGGNSPERRPLERSNSTIGKMPPPRAPPPKMQDLFTRLEKPVLTPTRSFDVGRDRSESIVRQVAPEDVYDDRNFMSRTIGPGYGERYAPLAGVRQISQTSQTSSTGTLHTMQSGSENWETFSEQSEPERDIDFHNYRQAAMAHNKRYTPDGGSSPRKVVGKKLRGIRSVDGQLMTEGESGRMTRVVEGSEAGWTDEDAF
jgi:protein regulator of cytokinesis 1